MRKFEKADLEKIEGYWINFEKLKKDMRYREWELLNPHQETDSNIGGGKSSSISDTTGNRAIILAEDKEYQNLKNIISTFENLYPELDEDQQTIVRMRYWVNKGCYEWKQIADTLYMSTWQVLRKRNVLIDETAKRLGWV